MPCPGLFLRIGLPRLAIAPGLPLLWPRLLALSFLCPSVSNEVAVGIGGIGSASSKSAEKLLTAPPDRFEADRARRMLSEGRALAKGRNGDTFAGSGEVGRGS